jgi:hypothetical protein
MLKKLAVASATVAAAAGLGLATPAYANGPVDIACVYQDIGKSYSGYSSGGLVYLIGGLGLHDILSHRDTNVDCDVDKQINNNTHIDSHKGRH